MRNRTIQLTALLAITVLAFTPFAGSTFLRAQDTTLFTIYVGAPTNNPARVAWAGIIADSIRRVGIDARLALGDWGVWIPRVLFPTPEDFGAPYIDGGYDIFFLGWTWGSSWCDPTSLYDSVSITLYNFQILNSTENDAKLNAIRTELNATARRELLWDWQEYMADISCVAVILYPNSTFAYDPALTGFAGNDYNFPVYGDLGIRHPTETELITAINADPLDFNWALSTAYYDQVATAVTQESLFYYADNDDMFNFVYTPGLAASDWVVEDNGLNWTLALRQDVYWPTGHQFTADDVILTWKAHVSDVSQASLYGQYVATGLTNESFIKIDDHTVRVRFDPDIGPYAWARQMLNVQPHPSFALSGVPFSAWKTHPYNAGTHWVTLDVNGAPYDVYGPLGLGAYVCHSATSGWDSVSRSFVANRRGSAGDPGLANGTKIAYYLGANGHGTTPMPDTYVAKTLSGPSAAIAALQAGEIDIIDYQFQIQTLQDQIDPAWGSCITHMELGHQFLGFNMMHPLIGTGEDTPNAQLHPENNATYAKYVRQALNYLIPRQGVIDNILEGYGVPGVECIPPLLPDFNSEMSPYTYDVEKAKELLRMAGYEIATPVELPPIALYVAAGVAVIAIVVAVFAIWKWRSK